MKYAVINDNKITLTDAKKLSHILNADLYSTYKSMDNLAYDLIIVIFKSTNGQISKSLLDFLNNIYNSNVALIAVGKNQFDINRYLKINLTLNNNILVYSKYMHKLDYEIVSKQLINKVVVSDGFSFNEKLAGMIYRKMKGVIYED